MATISFDNLAQLRQAFVGLSLAGAASAAGISPQRLREIEEGSDPSVYELGSLADTYGVEEDALYDEPIEIAAADGISMLASMEEYRELNDWTRARIIRAANAARDLRVLRRLLGASYPSLPVLPMPDERDTPAQQGASLALKLRTHLGLGIEPIASMRDLVLRHFPVIGLLYIRLEDAKLSGLGFADEHRGPAIVLNLAGKNRNPAVRRFSVAHELCHLLVDWNRAEPLASISGFLGEDEVALAREQRANAFAARFLCPESVVRGLDRFREEDAAQVLCGRYGLHYRAARLYLTNTTGHRLSQEAPRSLMSILTFDAWRDAEAPIGLDDFPEPAVAEERRGMLAHEASLAHSRGIISTERFARLLGVTTGHRLDDVLGYFELDAPLDVSDDARQASA